MAEDEQHPLIEKLHERRIRHQERGLVKRAGVIVIGFFLVLAGIVMSGPGVPGPGIATILLGLTFLALEFDRRSGCSSGRSSGATRRRSGRRTPRRASAR